MRTLKAAPRSGRSIETLSPTHLNVGIAHLKLGRTLLRAGRYSETAVERRVGYDIVQPHVGATNNFLKAAQKDLTAEYEALHDTAQAARFRAELADTVSTGAH